VRIAILTSRGRTSLISSSRLPAIVGSAARHDYSCHISTRPRVARHQPKFNWIAVGKEHDNGNCRRVVFYRPDSGRADGNQRIDSQVNEFLGQPREAFQLAVGESRLDDEVLTFDVPHLPQDHRQEAECRGARRRGTRPGDSMPRRYTLPAGCDPAVTGAKKLNASTTASPIRRMNTSVSRA